MAEKCVLCKKEIEENYGKLSGTVLRVVNEKKKAELLHVCNICQKGERWIEKAKVKNA